MSFAQFAQQTSPLSYRPPSPPKPEGPWDKPHRWQVSSAWICYPQDDLRNDHEIWWGYMVNPETGNRMDDAAWFIRQLTLMEDEPR